MREERGDMKATQTEKKDYCKKSNEEKQLKGSLVEKP